MTKIKTCGLRRNEDIDFANRLMPDYIGFVFASGKRRVSLEQASALKENLDKNIRSVGVFADEMPEFIIKSVQLRIIDIVQLHGSEDLIYIENLRKKISVPIIKAVRVRVSSDVTESEKLPCEYLLLDSHTKVQGGSGQTFDHSLIPTVKKPFFLAGGLNSDNVIKAIETVRPFAVDVSSGIEDDGIKSYSKMKEFIERVRKC